MLKIAITGNIASGKSAIEKILEKRGFSVLDSDKIVHDLFETTKIKTQITEEFSDLDIFENNSISRPKLGKIVFQDENKLKLLEKILHPEVKISIKNFFEKQLNKNEKFAFVSVPLLYEAKFENIFDRVVLVCSNDKTRLKRLMERNKLSESEAKLRIEKQISQEEKIPLADYVIYNNEDIESLSSKTDELLDYLSKNSTLPESK